MLEEDIKETEEFFFSFNFSVLGEMDSSLAPCALQGMQLSRLCLATVSAPQTSAGLAEEWGIDCALSFYIQSKRQIKWHSNMKLLSAAGRNGEAGFTPLFPAPGHIQRFLSLCM